MEIGSGNDGVCGMWYNEVGYEYKDVTVDGVIGRNTSRWVTMFLPTPVDGTVCA